MQEYCDKFNLKLNASKCKVMIFSRGKVRRFPDFYLYGEKLEVVPSFTYLGLLLNYNNDMKNAKTDLSIRGSRAMFSLLKKSNSLNIPIDVAIDLFDKTVNPVLLYGCEVWGFGNIDVFDKMQLKFYKMLLKLRNSTPSSMILGELGKLPLSNSIHSRLLNFWYKLVLDENKEKLSSVLYRYLFNLYCKDIHKCKYLQSIQKILISIGIPGLWDLNNTTHVNYNWFNSFVKMKLKDNFLQEWYNTVDNNTMYETYKSLKCQFGQENYINVLPKNCIITHIRFRTTNNQLPINTLRFCNVEKELRLCPKCNLQVIGNEYHYILICPHFDTQRRNLIHHKYHNMPTMTKFQNLFNSQDKRCLLKLKHLIDVINNELKT